MARRLLGPYRSHDGPLEVFPLYALEIDETRPLSDFLRMERGGERIERGRRIRVFWSEEGRCFELDARGHCWREVPGIGRRPPFEVGWRTLRAEAL